MLGRLSVPVILSMAAPSYFSYWRCVNVALAYAGVNLPRRRPDNSFRVLRIVHTPLGAVLSLLPTRVGLDRGGSRALARL